MTIRALLDGHNADLSALAVLTADDDPHVVHDDQEDRYFLEASELVPCSDNDELLDAARTLLVVVLGPARFERPGMDAVTVVGRFDGLGGDGNTTVVVLHDSARGTEAVGTPTLIQYDENDVEIPSTASPLNSTYRRYRALAAEHPSVAQVFEFYAESDPGWADLYNAFEVIRSSLKDAPKAEWGVESLGYAKTDISNFTATANLHRHARPTSRPKRELTLGEAQAFIRDLTERWLQRLEGR